MGLAMAIAYNVAPTAEEREFMKIIRDPVHGDIAIGGEEMSVVDTPQFQRLRGVRQLGTSYLVFPGAQHTRFEHSLGTCWIAKKMIAEINERARKAGLPETIPAEQARLISMAALLHDITHIPFGHTFEDERRILPPHDKSMTRLAYFLDAGNPLGRALDRLGLREDLVGFFGGGDRRPSSYAFELVAGAVCADLLDYLKRDAFFCGLNLAYDDRIFRYLNLEAGQLYFNLYSDRGFRQDAWSELVNLLRMRYHLTERVYYHHAKIASGAMLSRILEALLEAGGIQAEELYELRDDAFLFLLQQRIGRIPDYEPLLDKLVARKFYKRVYMVAKDPLQLAFPEPEHMERFQREFHMNEGQARTKLENRLARHLGAPPSAVIIYAPETNMRLKEARVTVRVDSGPLKSLADLKHPELDALRNQHRALWKFFLFMSPDYEGLFKKASRFMEREIGLPNQLELFNKGQLTLNLN